MFTNAIVRIPGKSLINGLSDSKSLGFPDYDKAIIQHKLYIEALKACGLEVTVLKPCEEYPDSTFIEDVALLTPQCAIITRPGAPSRRYEVTKIDSILRKEFSNVEVIEAPGTIEAGDIMMVDSHFYIGLSDRTNLSGAKQAIGILKKYGMTGSTVTLNDVLHLKTGLSYLENNKLVICGEFISDPIFKNYDFIEIPEEEQEISDPSINNIEANEEEGWGLSISSTDDIYNTYFYFTKLSPPIFKGSESIPTCL